MEDGGGRNYEQISHGITKQIYRGVKGEWNREDILIYEGKKGRISKK